MLTAIPAGDDEKEQHQNRDDKNPVARLRLPAAQ